MFTSKRPTCAGRTLDLPRKDRDIRYLRPLGNSDIANLTNVGRVDVRADIARVAGVSTGNVTKVKQLLDAVIPEVQDGLRHGEIRIHRAWQWRRLSREAAARRPVGTSESPRHPSHYPSSTQAAHRKSGCRPDGRSGASCARRSCDSCLPRDRNRGRRYSRKRHRRHERAGTRVVPAAAIADPLIRFSAKAWNPPGPPSDSWPPAPWWSLCRPSGFSIGTRSSSRGPSMT